MGDYFLIIDNSNAENFVIALKNSKYTPNIKFVGRFPLDELDDSYRFKINGEKSKLIKDYLKILKKDEFKKSKEITSLRKELIELAKSLYRERRLFY